MKMRQGCVERKTTETEIRVEILLDGEGRLQGINPLGFLDHMLVLWCRHSGFDMKLEAQGDLNVDFHHTVEDMGLCIGEAFQKALKDKTGINRYADAVLPMDEALVQCAVDISGRPGIYYNVTFPTEKVGNFDTELVFVFWQAFASTARLTIHINKLSGSNSHHLAEAIFKGMARVLKEAVKIEGRHIPSSKGVL